jgi:hypothetical protein
MMMISGVEGTRLGTLWFALVLMAALTLGCGTLRSQLAPVQFEFEAKPLCGKSHAIQLMLTDGRRPIPGATVHLSLEDHAGAVALVTDKTGRTSPACLRWYVAGDPNLAPSRRFPLEPEGGRPEHCLVRVEVDGYVQAALAVPVRQATATRFTLILQRIEPIKTRASFDDHFFFSAIPLSAAV